MNTLLYMTDPLVEYDDPQLQLLRTSRHAGIKQDLRNGRFLKGNRSPGRPRGVKNAEKIYLKSAPKLAKAYVKTACSGNAMLLKDAREWIMPVDTDAAAQSSVRVLIFVGADGLLPRSEEPLPLGSEGQKVVEISPIERQGTEG